MKLKNIVKKDFFHYSFQLTLLDAELQRKKDSWQWDPRHLPRYFKRLLKDIRFAKLTPEERKLIEIQKVALQKKFGEQKERERKVKT